MDAPERKSWNCHFWPNLSPNKILQFTLTFYKTHNTSTPVCGELRDNSLFTKRGWEKKGCHSHLKFAKWGYYILGT